MNVFELNYKSQVLNTPTKLHILVPQTVTRDQKGELSLLEEKKPYKVLYLLHGAFDDSSSWINGTKITSYLENKHVITVLPSVGNSFYHNMTYGLEYFTYLTEELPLFLQSIFPISTKKEDTFIAGNSMGGFGAIKSMLMYPERFQAAASLSGALDLLVPYAVTRVPGIQAELIFGSEEAIKRSENDLLYLMEQRVQEKRELPAIYQCVGDHDFLLDMNESFLNKAKELNIPVTFEGGEGIHDWIYWDKMIPRVLEFFGL